MYYLYSIVGATQYVRFGNDYAKLKKNFKNVDIKDTADIGYYICHKSLSKKSQDRSDSQRHIRSKTLDGPLDLTKIDPLFSWDAKELNKGFKEFLIVSATILTCSLIAMNILGVLGQVNSSVVYGVNIGLIGAGSMLVLGAANHLEKWRWKALLSSLVLGGGLIALNVLGLQGMISSPIAEYIHLGVPSTALAIAIPISLVALCVFCRDKILSKHDISSTPIYTRATVDGLPA